VRQRLLLAAGLSLVLHAVLFLALARLAEERPRTAPSRPLVVEVLQRPSRHKQAVQRTRPTPGAAHSASRTSSPPQAATSAPSATPGRSDAPRVAVDLFPEGALAVAAPGRPEPEAPDAGTPAEVIVRRIQGWRLESLAEYRVAVGVDSYFSTLAHALRDGLGAPPAQGSPRHGTPSAGQRWLQGWLAAVEEANQQREAPRAERVPSQAEHDLGGREGDMLRRLLGPMAPTQDSLVAPVQLLKRTQLPPSAVVRLEQDSEGHLTHAALVASSGDAGFDAFVLRSAALALAGVPKPPSYGAGLHPEGTRSEWAFYRAGEGVAVLLLRVY
jgi:hypothetical protein